MLSSFHSLMMNFVSSIEILKSSTFLPVVVVVLVLAVVLYVVVFLAVEAIANVVVDVLYVVVCFGGRLGYFCKGRLG